MASGKRIKNQCLIDLDQKIIMQQLWQINIGWDESVPISLHTQWTNYYANISTLNNLRITRNVNPQNKHNDFEIHGFCDASESAYGACIYARSKNKYGKITSELICSKSRVAPLKTISLPRLELCGALLLAKLVTTAKISLASKIKNITFWTDSTIVLAWIKTPPNQLKTFVANRVSKIQSLSENYSWRHVSTHDNPADIISRGLPANDLIQSKLWWSGPEWLKNKENEWPVQYIQQVEPTEMKTISLIALYTPPQILNKFSSFTKLQRVIAYSLRFINNSKSKIRQIGNLTIPEIENATIKIVSMIQQQVFQAELNDLQNEHQVHNKSRLLKLHPFIDKNGLIRVGGRLHNADITVDQRHPIVLPANHFVTQLIIEQEHKRLLHCGSEQLLASIRLRFWPLSGRRTVRKVTRSCLQCFRYKPTPAEHLMGILPKTRVLPTSRPFSTCGVDYAGPVQIRESRRRGRIHMSKGYIAIFVCFITKAVHIELVSALTTEAFLAALRRFTARRGICSRICSDNATNFTGANRELQEIYNFLTQNTSHISSELLKQKINWSFMPPRSPHFGGLWEAAVKSVKRHLIKISKNIVFTFKEYYTLLTQIEAVLNSRPLTQLSSDPNDLTPLTPSHFLIGDSLIEPPGIDYIDQPTNRLSRWQHIQQLRQHFWKRWQREYLHQLQERSKWNRESHNIQDGTMVLLMEDNLPPMKWAIGRIIATHPGQDSVVRVVSVKTSSGTYKRSIRKLCVLPLNEQ